MIRGIDNQIMINKSVDYAKQMADQINNVRQGQDFISEMEKARMKQKDNAVTETDHAENGRIRREKDNKGQQGQSERDEDAPDRKEGEKLNGKNAMGVGTSIDINI